MIRVVNTVPSTGNFISTASIEAVEIVSTNAVECYSVCLYDEPEYKKLHPTRNFAQRYLQPFQEDVKKHLDRNNMALNIFCDEKSLDLALSLKTGSVYLVKQRVLYPFFQHLYRYYSVFLDHPTIQTYHFRGMDNIICSDNAMSNLREFHTSGMDVLNMPYSRKYKESYCPIRGSCSVSRRGILSLRNFLKENRFFPDMSDKRLIWHSDEDFLTIWFNAIKNYLSIYTIIDRELPMDFYLDLTTMIKASNDFVIKRTTRGDI
jgi:hypothetical protein